MDIFCRAREHVPGLDAALLGRYDGNLKNVLNVFSIYIILTRINNNWKPQQFFQFSYVSTADMIYRTSVFEGSKFNKYTGVGLQIGEVRLNHLYPFLKSGDFQYNSSYLYLQFCLLVLLHLCFVFHFSCITIII